MLSTPIRANRPRLARTRISQLVQLSLGLTAGSLLMAVAAPVRAQSTCNDGGENYCYVGSVGTPGQPPSKPGRTQNGNPGNPGNPSTTVTTTLGAISATYASDGLMAGIQIESIGGNGSAGSNASDNDKDPPLWLVGGAGGTAGATGDANLTLTQGANVQALGGSIGNNPGFQPPAIWVYSGGGSGGGGGIGTPQGGNGMSQVGAIAGNVTITNLANPNQVDTFFTQGAAKSAVASVATGMFGESVGGNGGSGNDHIPGYADQGVDAAPGGNGGNVTITSNTSVVGFSDLGQGGAASSVQGAGIWAMSAGGNGGTGGSGTGKGPSNSRTGPTDGVGAQGGNGANGGLGGNVLVTVQGGSVATLSGVSNTPAIWAQSLGGIGGAGGDPSGNSGSGADAGTVGVTNAGALSTATAPHSPGILAQSFGGAGAFGGRGDGWIGSVGGEGGTGGSGMQVIVTNQAAGQITTATKDSAGVLAQSIGGGGGNGGDSNGWLSIGGNGAVGGNGGSVILNNMGSITTSGNASAGMTGQSIGGGGGNGGNVTKSSGLGINLVVGGSGAGGGDGNYVTAFNSGNITTTGQHSSGIEMQSIGGGGGKGGAAFGDDTSSVFGAQESVGGSGGAGGAAQWLGYNDGQRSTNTGTIQTSGSDSFGIIAQSIGGGGGIGAASVGEAKVYAPDNLPGLSLTASIGGQGGAGGDGNTVAINNGGLITTTGAGSIGMVAQSIGGGGGAGGDAKASSTANGGDVNIAVSVALGGKGGGAGNGSTVSADNAGMIVTTGESADAILAQSIGGGGGNGGGGDAKANATGAGTGFSATLAIGGTAGGGGNAQQGVESTNAGAILTLGDGASGIVAQAIGGGGGRGGGGAGTAQGDSDDKAFAAKVTIGGAGGNGGSTISLPPPPAPAPAPPSTMVSVTNSANASIVTFGADAPGIVAQSIGGGGGMGGKSATTIGGKKSTNDGGNGSSNTDTALNNIKQAFQGGGVGQFMSTQALVNQANALLTPPPPPGSSSTGLRAMASTSDDPEQDADSLNDLGESEGDAGDGSSSTSIKVNVGVGGKGGTGGTGGIVTVKNNGSIGTVGAMSDGVLAQSIGGGGGKGGAATPSTSKGDANANVNVGGSDGVAGAAGDVTVTNGGGASIITTGALANGIVAQSISGGGGVGGVGGARNGPLKDVSINIGADGASSGLNDKTVSSGLVTVNNDAGATIITQSHNASAIIAQSIGGGGGIVKSFSTDAQDNNGGGANADPVGIKDTNPAHNITLTFGGSKNSTASDGWAGNVMVNQNGSVTTSGRNGYGVLAQSIGGGGGATLGGNIAAGSNFFGTGKMIGDGGTTTVNVGGSITTSGQGAMAVLAQSIGGGGGLAGDTGWTASQQAFDPSWNHPGDGNGGAVNVNVGTGASLVTNAASNTPVIWAQSIGGGGGRITTQQGAYVGSAGGTGNGGVVSVNVSGSVSAKGVASPGIYAESSGHGGAGTSGSQVNVTVNAGGSVSGGTDFSQGDGSGAGVQVVDGSSSTTTTAMNQVTNSGTITSVNGVGGTALTGSGGQTYVHNLVGGVMNGSVDVTLNGGNGSTLNDGIWNTGSKVGAAFTQNNGVLDIGGKGAAGAGTEVSGNLAQGASGRIVIDSDHVAGTSDRLTVDGNATLAGAIQMRPSRLSSSTAQVVDVKGQLDASQLKSADPMLVHYQLSTAGTTASDGSAQQSVFVTPQARFDAAATGLGKNAESVAAHLQANFNAGADSLGTPLAQLANGVQDPTTYKAALTSLGNEAQQAVGTSRLAASHAFVERMNSCPTFDQPQGTDMKERECAWGRVIDNRTTDSGADRTNYSASTHSVQVGGQKQIADGWFLGGSAAFDSENLSSSTGAGSVSGNGGSIGAVIKHEVGNWTFSGAADAGYGRYDTLRNIAFPGYAAQAKGSFNLTEFGLHSRIAYLIPQDNWYLKPYLDLHAVHMHTGSYSETGAGPLGLNVNGNSDTMLSASPMLEVGGRVDMDNGMTLRPYVAVGATVQNKNEWGATSQFQGAAPGVAPFETAASVPSTLGNVRLGVNLLVKKNLEVKVEYSGQFGSGYRSNEGIIRVNYLF
ncbi:hypothetical protein WKW79_23575 [Variovorax robiniae]|uniref:Autotransporter domain-containing protein n=1 Tax=Variovorax robiniae TaxID=1836199 RepID=A0ABU8XFY1_9BURK